ncbi:MAG: shikimate kinase [Cyanobacteria bacterium J06638_22]
MMKEPPISAATMASRLQGTNIVLIGMMGCGKTTVGQYLAEALNYRFFDTDAVVASAAHKTIPEIFATDGEQGFREIETQVLAELSAYSRLVIATGGGIVLARKNWSYLHHSVVVWLDVPVEHLYQRIKGDSNRPLLQSPNPQQTLHNLLEERRSLYAQADVRVVLQGDEPPEWVCDRVIQDISQILNPVATEFPSAAPPAPGLN